MASALELISIQSHDAISVADIAAHAAMTPAAFYYHFASKDELLEEFVRTFAATFLTDVTALFREVQDRTDVPALVDRFVEWVEERELEARVYFVGSVGATAATEAARTKSMNKLYTEAGNTAKRVNPGLSAAQAAVAGVAMMSLLQVAARSRLEQDDVYRTLGPARFRAEIASLAELIGA